MPDTEAKLEAVLAKMDDLFAAKDEQESKLNAILLKFIELCEVRDFGKKSKENCSRRQ